MDRIARGRIGEARDEDRVDFAAGAAVELAHDPRAAVAGSQREAIGILQHVDLRQRAALGARPAGACRDEPAAGHDQVAERTDAHSRDRAARFPRSRRDGQRVLAACDTGEKVDIHTVCGEAVGDVLDVALHGEIRDDAAGEDAAVHAAADGELGDGLLRAEEVVGDYRATGGEAEPAQLRIENSRDVAVHRRSNLGGDVRPESDALEFAGLHFVRDATLLGRLVHEERHKRALRHSDGLLVAAALEELPECVARVQLQVISVRVTADREGDRVQSGTGIDEGGDGGKDLIILGIQSGFRCAAGADKELRRRDARFEGFDSGGV